MTWAKELNLFGPPFSDSLKMGFTKTPGTGIGDVAQQQSLSLCSVLGTAERTQSKPLIQTHAGLPAASGPPQAAQNLPQSRPNPGGLWGSRKGCRTSGPVLGIGHPWVSLALQTEAACDSIPGGTGAGAHAFPPHALLRHSPQRRVPGAVAAGAFTNDSGKGNWAYLPPSPPGFSGSRGS